MKNYSPSKKWRRLNDFFYFYIDWFRYKWLKDKKALFHSPFTVFFTSYSESRGQKFPGGGEGQPSEWQTLVVFQSIVSLSNQMIPIKLVQRLNPISVETIFQNNVIAVVGKLIHIIIFWIFGFSLVSISHFFLRPFFPRSLFHGHLLLDLFISLHISTHTWRCSKLTLESHVH